jgi:hypothetical protein
VCVRVRGNMVREGSGNIVCVSEKKHGFGGEWEQCVCEN